MPKTPALKLAVQFKEFCRALIKERVRTKADKENLAKELDISLGGVEALIYHGRGSFESYVAAFSVLYGFDLKDFKNALLDLRDGTRKVKPARNSDRIWFELDKYYSEDHKEYIASVWRAAEKLNYKVVIRKNAKKSAKKDGTPRGKSDS